MVSKEALEHGFELFNAGEFYECHEVLEDVWRPTHGEMRLFLQAVIHFAVGLYHHQEGNPIGAELQLEKGVRKLAGYLPYYSGVDTAQLYREGQAALHQVKMGQAVSLPRITRRSS